MKINRQLRSCKMHKVETISDHTNQLYSEHNVSVIQVKYFEIGIIQFTIKC